jgi:hypothetical protein
MTETNAYGIGIFGDDYLSAPQRRPATVPTS